MKKYILSLKKYFNFDNGLFISSMLIFSVILISCLTINYKMTEKDELVEHEIAHINMPKYAIGMNLYYNKMFFLMRDIVDHAHKDQEIRMIRGEYSEVANKLRRYREVFEKTTNSHDIRWSFDGGEKHFIDQEHQDIHDENLSIISECKDEFDKFMILSDDFFIFMTSDQKEKAIDLFNVEILSLNDSLITNMDRFMEFQEREEGFHTNELRNIQKSENNLILALIINIIIFAIIWVSLFLISVYNLKKRKN